MPSYNKVILIGNLTRDPEIRYTPSGTAIAKFGLAINRTFRTGDEQREETTFVDIDAFGRQAEVIGEYVKKGRPLMVEGRLRTDSWEDKNTGQKRSRLGVVLESFQFLDSRMDRGQDDGGYGGAPQSSSRQQFSSPPQSSSGYDSDSGGGSHRQSAPSEPPLDDDDVPF